MDNFKAAKSCSSSSLDTCLFRMAFHSPFTTPIIFMFVPKAFSSTELHIPFTKTTRAARRSPPSNTFCNPRTRLLCYSSALHLVIKLYYYSGRGFRNWIWDNNTGTNPSTTLLDMGTGSRYDEYWDDPFGWSEQNRSSVMLAQGWKPERSGIGSGEFISLANVTPQGYRQSSEHSNL